MSYIEFPPHTLEDCEMPMFTGDADDQYRLTCQTCGKVLEGTDRPPLEPPPLPAETSPSP